MAINWGDWKYAGGNGMRVGIDISRTTVDCASSTVTWTLKIYTENQYTYSDNQGLSYTGNISGSHSFTNNDGKTQQLRDTITDTFTYSNWGIPNGTRTYGVQVTGTSNGITPTVESKVDIPNRPFCIPAVETGLTLTRNSDTQSTLTWTIHSPQSAPYRDQLIQTAEWLFSGPYSAWSDTATVSGGATNYVWPGLRPNGVYRQQIRANNSSGSSVFSVDSNDIFTTPAAPSAVKSALSTSGTTITTTWRNNAYTFGTTNTWSIQRSVAGGAFANVVTGLAQATTTWTDPSPGSGTNQYRVAILQSNGALQSAYSTGNVVSTTAPPLAPTLLSPNGQSVDFVNDAVTFTWQHNPAGDQVPQTHFTIETSINSGSTWVAMTGATNVASSVSSYTLPAGNLVNGTPYLWRVRTEGTTAAGFGPNSTPAAVTGSTKPTVTLSLPASTTTTFPIQAAWAYAQPDLLPQTAYQALLFASDGVTLLQEIDNFGTGTTVNFSYVPTNGFTYVVSVRAQSSVGVWSNYASATTLYTLLPPATPIPTGVYQKCTGTVLLHVDPGTTIPGTNVTADSIEIERRTDGGDWIVLGTGILFPTDFIDTLPKTNGLNEYRVTSQSSLPSFAAAPILQVYGTDGAVDGDPLWAWLSYGDTFEFDLRVHGELAISETSGRQKAVQAFLGRARPVALVGANTTRSIGLSGTLWFDRRCPPSDDGCTYDSAPADWRDAGLNSEVVCYRDFTGRRVFGVLSDVQVTDGVWPGKAAVSFTVTEVDFTERYVQLVSQ